jgi:hypothetical protein
MVVELITKEALAHLREDILAGSPMVLITTLG